jgi:YggT family protein
MGNILSIVIDILYWALVILIFARVILSWVRFGSYEIRDLVFRITDPILEPVRRILPPMSGFDLGPFIVIILAFLVREILKSVVSSL